MADPDRCVARDNAHHRFDQPVRRIVMDILHRVGIKSSSDEVYKALATREGLAAWWTDDTQGESKVGGVFQFRFSARGTEIGGFDMKILELDPARHVLWQVVDGPVEWVGTRISWQLKQDGEYCIVLLKHEDWRELVETGKGAPNPHDIKIDNWN